MVATLVSLVLLAYGLVLLMACFTAWGYVYRRLTAGQPILQERDAPPVRWGLLDVLGGSAGLILLAILLQTLFVALLGNGGLMVGGELSLGDRVASIWGLMLAELTVCGIILLAIIHRGGGSQIIGTSRSEFWHDVVVGVFTFCALCVPVLIIQMLIAYFVPYEHPLIELLVESPQAWILIPVVFSAVIVAPLTEEFAFRLVLQGWLQDLMRHRLRGGREILLGSTDSKKPSDAIVDAEIAEVRPLPTLDENNPYASPHAADYPRNSGAAEEAILPLSRGDTALRAWFPIFVSASIFALLHAGQGAAWIPLFFLALGLGYVYQKTHTLTASVVVHMLLNGQSMVFLLLQIFVGDQLEPPDTP